MTPAPVCGSPATAMNERAMSALIPSASFYGSPSRRRPARVLMIAGRPRTITGVRDLVRALADAVVDRFTSGSGVVTEAELLSIGFDPLELSAHFPAARDRAARALADRRV